ncbi:unnamed protein product [Macrosiphum euphorbiae]|uniref:Uncharacterized protein n=1 Tax=Macrosiphum euphorbiae TaxID=13131 RepID=A0AAV0XPD9_9HEMI|nr:unnamed protein product [Macrosiphum euphorbiae]CAI6377161.1 unnamed protein product [Macrosiphum euphorbiae]
MFSSAISRTQIFYVRLLRVSSTESDGAGRETVKPKDSARIGRIPAVRPGILSIQTAPNGQQEMADKCLRSGKHHYGHNPTV